MAALQPLQASFAFGEISPRLRGRPNTERYQQSVDVALNVLTTSHGTVSKRPGFTLVEKSPTDRNIKLLPFQFDVERPYAVEVGYKSGAGYLRMLSPIGYLRSGDQLVANADFASNLRNWVEFSVGRGDTRWAPGGFVEFAPSDHPTQGGQASLYQAFNVNTTGVQHVLRVRALSDAVGTWLNVLVGTSAGDGSLLTTIVGNGETDLNFTPSVNPVYLSMSVVPGVEATYLVDYALVYEGAAVPPVAEVAAPWSENAIPQITSELSTSERSLYLTESSQPQQRVVFDEVTETFVLQAVPFTNAPPQWSAGNYPSTAAFFGRRLWYAGVPSDPSTLWGSQVNDFLSFDQGVSDPEEAIEFTMASRGNIQWISGAKNLIAGTDLAEYIFQADSGVLQPGDIAVEKQSTYGSVLQVAAELGNGVLYLGNDRRRIRFMSYQFLDNGWISTDLTWPSEHLTRSRVVEHHFLYSPDPLILCILEDGTYLTAVYEREQNIVGWHRQETDGVVVTGTMLKHGDTAELWLAVRRYNDGGEFVSIERTIRDSDRYTFARVFSDSAVFSFSPTYSQVFSGFDHLEGNTVSLLVDGAVHPDRQVIGGAVTLDPSFGGTICIGGLGYTGVAKTLPLEGGNPSGTAMPVIRRWNRVFLRLVDSFKPLVNGILVGARTSDTPMGQVQPLENGDYQVGQEGIDRLAQLEITMPLPGPYNVAGLFGDMGQGDL